MKKVLAIAAQKKEEALKKLLDMRQEVKVMYNQCEEDDEQCTIVGSSATSAASETIAGSSKGPKKPQIKGPINAHFKSQIKQSTINSHMKVKEEKIRYDF